LLINLSIKTSRYIFKNKDLCCCSPQRIGHLMMLQLFIIQRGWCRNFWTCFVLFATSLLLNMCHTLYNAFLSHSLVIQGLGHNHIILLYEVVGRQDRSLALYLFQFFSRRPHGGYLLTSKGFECLCYKVRVRGHHLFPPRSLHNICHVASVDELNGLSF